ncbi:MAG: CocE/NonD family hydrolase [Ilumatobacteraceae bacterium]
MPGPHRLDVIAEDGVRLAVDLYLPDGTVDDASSTALATLIEALPYRKDDVTSSYASTYERYVAAGFAVVRVDLRGTGSSAGVADDEYPEVERTDLRSVVRWIAAQPWSSGRVGLFGTSYSGFNALQMAAEIERLAIPRLNGRRRLRDRRPGLVTCTTAAGCCGRST